MREMRRNILWKSLTQHRMILIFAKEFSRFLRRIINVILINVPVNFRDILPNMVADHLLFRLGERVKTGENYSAWTVRQCSFNFFGDTALKHTFICNSLLEKFVFESHIKRVQFAPDVYKFFLVFCKVFIKGGPETLKKLKLFIREIIKA